jgi:hypothetical protein
MEWVPYSKAQAVAALQAFQRRHGLRDYPWEVASGLGAGVLRRFVRGPTNSMSVETYEKLAAGAQALLAIPVTAAELRGERPPRLTLAVGWIIGQGGELQPVPEGRQRPTLAPPEVEGGGGAYCRDEHGAPVLAAGDVIFWERPAADPLRVLGKVAMVQTDRAWFLGRLAPGAQVDRFLLLRLNPAAPPLENQRVVAAARARWIRLPE